MFIRVAIIIAVATFFLVRVYVNRDPSPRMFWLDDDTADDSELPIHYSAGLYENRSGSQDEDADKDDIQDRRNARTVFGYSIGTTVMCYPRKGGRYTLYDCSVVELDFLGLDRFTPAQRSYDATEEEAFCGRMRQLGAQWSRISADGSEVIDLYSPVLYVGWPAGGGVWVVKMAYWEASRKGLGRISNAATMEERCRLIERLGGIYYEVARECPHLDLKEADLEEINPAVD